MTNTPQPLNRRQASWLLLLAVLVLLLAGVGLDSLSPSLLLIGAGVLAAIPALWWLWPSDHERRLPPPSVVLPGLTLLALQAFSLMWTPFPAPAYKTWVETCLLLSLLVVVTDATRRGWGPRSWQDAVIVTALVLAVLEMLLFGLWLLEWQALRGPVDAALPPAGYRASGLLLGHPNVLAGLINLALPLIVVRWFSQRDTPSRHLVLIPFALLLAGLYLTSSRAGWISGGLGLATVVLLLLVATRSSSSSSMSARVRRIPRWQWAVGLLTVVLVGAGLYWQLSSSGRRPLTQARSAVWQASVELIGQSPISGHGLRAFPVRYASLPFNYHEEDIPHAHNLLLQVAVENGAAGVVVLLVLLFYAGRIGWRRWRDGSVTTRIALSAYAGAAAACLSHNLFDYLLGPPLYSAAVVFLAGAALGGTGAVNLDGPRPVSRLALGLAPLLAVGAMALTLGGAWDQWRGALAGQTHDWPEAASRLCRAAQANPAEPVAASGCGLATWLAGLKDGPPPATSLAALTAATERDPGWGTHAANLGAGLLAGGDAAAAVEALDAALAVHPTNPDLLLTRGYAAELLGDLSSAKELYLAALERNPWGYNAAFLQAEPWRTAGIDLEGLADDFTSGQAHLWQAQLAVAQGDQAAAAAALDRAAPLTPGNYRLAVLRAELALLAGDAREALHQARLANFLDSDQPAAREILAVALLADRSSNGEAGQAIVRAAEGLVFTSRSQRYFFAAHGRLGLATDRAPNLILGSASARLVALAQALVNDHFVDLTESERLALSLLIRHCACQPEGLMGDPALGIGAAVPEAP